MACTWTPSPHATYIELIKDPDDANPTSLLIDHLQDPFECPLADQGEKTLQQVAYRYLKALHDDVHIGPEFAGVPPEWLEALNPDHVQDEPRFGWLPLDWASQPGAETFVGPYGSFRYESRSEKFVALFASERFGPFAYLGSGFGLAVIIHINGTNDRASIAGMSATLPFGAYLHGRITRERSRLLELGVDPTIFFLNSSVLEAMSVDLGLQEVLIRGVRIAAPDVELDNESFQFEAQAVGVRTMVAEAAQDGLKTGGLQVPYFVSMRARLSASLTPSVEFLHVTPLVADGGGDAKVFDLDPSSHSGKLVRPTRDEAELDLDRSVVPVVASKATLPLEHSEGTAKVKVMPCPRFVIADRADVSTDPRPIKDLDGTGPRVRTDDASAVQALFHARELLKRMKAYGWSDPGNYFRITKPEFRIYYRSGVSPGPGKDGRTVNARVIPEGWPPDAIGRGKDDQTRPAIEMHLAWADLRRREREKWVSTGKASSPAIPFGIAADKRWMWHEFGHALLVASTGELEFRFAHSAGDAMAAIALDPASKLPAEMRGQTFPFVSLCRRHDRCAHHGWSWNGLLHRDLKAVPASSQPRRKAYWSEQILSTSLFRLYRCLGGDTCLGGDPTQADPISRFTSSHYTLYLIMQAMSMMGDVRIQVVSTPAKFARLLKEADRQGGVWSALLDQTYEQVGGTAGKAIRWAFEGQGLYALPTQAEDGAGAPPAVDIYIDDQRPGEDAMIDPVFDYGRGSYVPVSLHWEQPSVMTDKSAAASLWQANAATGMVWRPANGEVVVLVNNRGRVKANNVVVRLWYVEWPDATDPPQWNDGGWMESTDSPSVAKPVGDGESVQFPAFAFAPAAPGRYVLFAEATCPDDRAHTDSATGLACASLKVPLPSLVANDNNLAVRVVVVPA